MQNKKTSDSFHYQYLSEEDVSFLKDIVKNKPDNYPRMITSRNTAKLHPGFSERLNKEFSTLIGIDESTTLPTKVYLIINEMKEIPNCPICGKSLKNVINTVCGFKKFCSQQCSSKSPDRVLKCKKTKLERYGDENYHNIKKMYETNIKIRGVKCSFQDPIAKEKAKQTNIKKRGTPYPSQSKEVRAVYEQTCLRKYNVRHYSQSKEYREKYETTCLNLYNVKNAGGSKQAQEKIRQTKRKNKSWNKSKIEEAYYEFFCLIFGKHNIIRQYRSEEYPFNCDFYIISENKYIEINGDPSHGKHPFDPNNPDDLKIVEEWKIKANGNPKSRYSKFVYGWTDRDVKKREIAKKNNLNFEEIWP